MKLSVKRDWMIYMLRCKGGSLYTGITKDIPSRLKKHRAGKGAAYTRSHRPLRLVHQEGPFTHSKALMREAAIKRLPRSEKQKLLASM